MGGRETPVDLIIVMCSIASVVFIVVSAAYIVFRRNQWLPFRCKYLRTFLIGEAGGITWLVSLLVVNKHLHLDMSDSDCVYWIYWVQLLLGQNLFVYSLVVRSIRTYFILVKQRTLPRKSYVYILISLIPSLFISIVSIAERGAKEDNGLCVVDDVAWTIVLGMFIIFPHIFLLIFSWLTRSVRQEFNENRVAFMGGMFSVFATVVISFIIINDWRKYLFGRAVITLIILWNINYYYWFTIGESLWACIRDDRAYLRRFENLFRRANPFFFGSRLDDLLLDEEWRANFKEYAAQKYCLENVEFWEQLLVREQMIQNQSPDVVSYTEDIIRMFIANGSEKEINISWEVRDAILESTNKTDPNLFSRARDQIYQLLNTNLFVQYVKNKSYEQWRQEEEKTRLENELLRQEGIIDGKNLNVGIRRLDERAMSLEL